MNNELFQLARNAYVSKDYETALTQFTECLQENSNELAPGELGLLYHQIGNCLVKLHDPNEAIHAYSQAALDSLYDGVGSVNYNLGMVYASMNDYENAIVYFKNATEDPGYQTPHKAYLGLGNSLLKLGKSAEAGAAFRNAALDETNPDPTKALLNLGVCFMALGRPMDAVASYESALQFDMLAATRNRVFANMGQAYVAAGKWDKAVRSFESALADKTYVFNDAANVDYQRAVAMVAKGISDEPEAEPAQNDLSGLDVSGDGLPYEAEYTEDAALPPSDAAETTVMTALPENEEAFFTQDLNAHGFHDWEKGMKKKKRNRGLKIIIFIVILLLILVGGALFAYTQGYGYPSKQDVVTELFSDPENADVYAASVDDAKKSRITDLVTTDTKAEIVGEANDTSTAKVYVNAKASGGGEVPYEVIMVRDGIGWKVSNVSLYFASQHS